MTTTTSNQDPLEFLKNFWGNMGFPLPGMVTPTVDTDELGRRITDLKAVEGWLKANLSMLQVTIQGLEMQRATLSAFQSMSQGAAEGSSAEGGAANPFANPAMWPWNFMTPSAEGGEAAKPSAGPATGGDAPGTESDSAAKGKPKR